MKTTSNLNPRNDKGACPICGKPVAVGASANWCPEFHYTIEHVRIGRKEYVVAEMFPADGYTIRYGHIGSIYAPLGLSVVAQPVIPADQLERAKKAGAS